MADTTGPFAKFAEWFQLSRVSSAAKKMSAFQAEHKKIDIVFEKLSEETYDGMPVEDAKKLIDANRAIAASMTAVQDAMKEVNTTITALQNAATSDDDIKKYRKAYHEALKNADHKLAELAALSKERAADVNALKDKNSDLKNDSQDTTALANFYNAAQKLTQSLMKDEKLPSLNIKKTKSGQFGITEWVGNPEIEGNVHEVPVRDASGNSLEFTEDDLKKALENCNDKAQEDKRVSKVDYSIKRVNDWRGKGCTLYFRDETHKQQFHQELARVAKENREAKQAAPKVEQKEAGQSAATPENQSNNSGSTVQQEEPPQNNQSNGPSLGN